MCNKCPWPCGVSKQLSFATLRQSQRKKVCKLTSSKRSNIMLWGVPRCPCTLRIPLWIAHACRDMQKHVWTCICLQLFLNCIEKLSTNTALCISQRQPHTQLAPRLATRLATAFAFLGFPFLRLSRFALWQASWQAKWHARYLFVCSWWVPHPDMPHIPDIPDICTICLLCPPFSSLPVVTFQGIHALFIFFYHIPPAAFLFRATLKFYKCRWRIWVPW